MPTPYSSIDYYFTKMNTLSSSATSRACSAIAGFNIADLHLGRNKPGGRSDRLFGSDGAQCRADVLITGAGLPQVKQAKVLAFFKPVHSETREVRGLDAIDRNSRGYNPSVPPLKEAGPRYFIASVQENVYDCFSSRAMIATSQGEKKCVKTARFRCAHGAGEIRSRLIPYHPPGR